MMLLDFIEQLQRIPDKHLEVYIAGQPVDSIECCSAYPPRKIELVACLPEFDPAADEEDDE